MKKIISVLLAALMLAAVAASNGVFVASTLPGDVNGDGEVNNKDVVVLFRHISSGVLSEDETVYDYNKDGNVDNKDVVSLFRSVSGSGAVSVYDGYVSKLVDGYYERADDDDIYYGALSKFEQLRLDAEKETDPDKRAVIYAKAEAELLDSAVMIPTYSSGASFALATIAPHTTSDAEWGIDEYRLKGMVISDEFLTPAERNDLLTMWDNARQGNGTYDPAAYLKSKGHKIKTEYAAVYSNPPSTLDWQLLNNSRISILANVVDALVEYDNLGVLQPALAESWKISDDGLTYTFNIRKGVYWYTSEGKKYAEVTANDFEAGFRHMLDSRSEYYDLIAGTIEGVKGYLAGYDSWDYVGYKAKDKYTLVITLEKPAPYLLSMLNSYMFLPMCDSFYRSKGGVYGDEFSSVYYSETQYKYGTTEDVTSQVYCGPYILKQFDSYGETVAVKNQNYYKASDVKLDKIRFVYFDGSESSYIQYYKDTCNGIYDNIGLSYATVLGMAESDGNMDKYAYLTDNDHVTYFITLTLNRGAFALDNGNLASDKTERQKADTATAMNNKNFRQALAFAFDRATWSGLARGPERASVVLRNTYTPPKLLYLSKDVKADGHTFKAGTYYGDIVQYYLDKLGSPIKVEDGQDGWYNPDAAKEAVKAAKKELGDSVSWPIVIDVTYSTRLSHMSEQMEAYKADLESVLGEGNVIVNLIGTEDTNDYYYSAYRAKDGGHVDTDVCFTGGWSPDYRDPSTFLDTFAPHGELVHLFGVY